MSRVIPDVSLLICTRNRRQMLADTLESVLAGDRVPAELIVVDQSDAPDDVSRNCDGCEIRHVRLDSIGLSRANNAAIRAARHELLVFTHDDVRVTPGWFGAVVAALVRFGPGTAVTGRILATAPEAVGGFAPTLAQRQEPAMYRGRIGFDVLKPLNMGMYREMLDRVGGFDERLGPGTPFPGAEDSDLGHRLLEAGYRIAYVPEAVLYHRAWRSGREYLPLRWRYGMAQGAFYAKHVGRDGYMLRRMRVDAADRLRSAARELRTDRVRASGKLIFLAGNAAGMGRWWMRYGFRRGQHD